jgi:hypothetical protein
VLTHNMVKLVGANRFQATLQYRARTGRLQSRIDWSRPVPVALLDTPLRLSLSAVDPGTAAMALAAAATAGPVRVAAAAGGARDMLSASAEGRVTGPAALRSRLEQRLAAADRAAAETPVRTEGGQDWRGVSRC